MSTYNARLIVGERANTDDPHGVWSLEPPSYTHNVLVRLYSPVFRDYRTTNLWGWSGDERPARERANEIVDWFLPPSDLGPLLIIALGNKVADAFGVPRGRTWFEHYVNLDDGFVVVKFPHPSGRNRLWNDPTMRARASFLLETLVTL